MSLFVLSCKDGWVNIMYDGLDAVGEDKQVGGCVLSKRCQIGLQIKTVTGKELKMFFSKLEYCGIEGQHCISEAPAFQNIKGTCDSPVKVVCVTFGEAVTIQAESV